MEHIQKLVSEELNLINLQLKKISVSENFTDINRFLMSPKKRIRSLVVLLYLKSQGLNIDEKIINLLCATELIHNASLLHDDVLDGADERRGSATISKKYSSQISILSGDLLISKAVEKLIEINDNEIMILYKDCVQQMCEAEIKQYFYRNTMPSKVEYLSICEGKTAKLFEVCLKSCGKLLDTNEDAAADFGRNFGILYQIKNDLNKASAELDKKNGIYTALDILGIEKTNSLIDNYVEDINRLINYLPQNGYKSGLKELLKLI